MNWTGYTAQPSFVSESKKDPGGHITHIFSHNHVTVKTDFVLFSLLLLLSIGESPTCTSKQPRGRQRSSFSQHYPRGTEWPNWLPSDTLTMSRPIDQIGFPYRRFGPDFVIVIVRAVSLLFRARGKYNIFNSLLLYNCVQIFFMNFLARPGRMPPCPPTTTALAMATPYTRNPSFKRKQQFGIARGKDGKWSLAISVADHSVAWLCRPLARVAFRPRWDDYIPARTSSYFWSHILSILPSTSTAIRFWCTRLNLLHICTRLYVYIYCVLINWYPARATA